MPGNVAAGPSYSLLYLFIVSTTLACLVFGISKYLSSNWKHAIYHKQIHLSHWLTYCCDFSVPVFNVSCFASSIHVFHKKLISIWHTYIQAELIKVKTSASIKTCTLAKGTCHSPQVLVLGFYKYNFLSQYNFFSVAKQLCYCILHNL